MFFLTIKNIFIPFINLLHFFKIILTSHSHLVYLPLHLHIT